MKRFVLTGAAAVFAMIAGAAKAEAPVTIHLAWVLPISNWASIIYEKKDLMKHYGKTYQPELVHFQATPAMIQALAAGEIEVADLAYSSLAIAIENAGMTDLRIIGDESQDGVAGHSTGQYFVLKDGPVKTIDDLKGKVIATVATGAALDIPVRAMLRKHGLEATRDYTVVEAAFPNMLPMLLDHKVDFIMTANPFARDPRFKDKTRVLFTVAEAMGGPTQTVVWTARQGFIDAHRAAMVDMMEDAVRAVRFLTDPANHAETVAIAARISKQPAANLDYVYGPEDPYRDPNMLPNIANLQRTIDVQQETGFLKQKLDIAPYSDLSLVKEGAARIQPKS
ncbi:MAG TPA: ABC transporter substrate-binding protein [Stellaceae bacterium]|nr:ABC transporter substrate-binding protein [Stellaceae bacterium]